MSMFCFQCQETAKGTGCTVVGVCGKKDDLANMQDLLIYTIKGVAIVNTMAREIGINQKKTDQFIINGLFMTITNANWDKNEFFNTVREGLELREEIKAAIKNNHIFMGMGFELSSGDEGVHNDSGLCIR